MVYLYSFVYCRVYIGSFFYNNMLDELGININLFRVGEYKGAAENYVRTDFSKENEEQYLNLLATRPLS